MKPFYLFLSVVCINIASAKTLIISDSHGVGAFGRELARLVELKKEKVSFYAFGGSKAVDWIEGNNLTWGYWEHHTGAVDKKGTNRAVPIFTELLTLHKPQNIIIVQGTNMVWYKQTSAHVEHVRFLMRKALDSGATCTWIGPPDLNVKTVEQQKLVDELHAMLLQEAHSMGCHFIESWNFTNYPQGTGDGIHYDQIPFIGAGLARQWAQGVAARLVF